LKKIIYILPFFLFWECERATLESEEETSKIVARAGDEKLGYEKFAEDFVSRGIIKDSAYNAKKSIEKWATESLFYQEALEKLEASEIKIEQEVNEYRKALVNHIYQSKILEEYLDTNITSQEIEEYYNTYRDNFILKENIVKVIYFKIPLKAPGLLKIKNLVFSKKPKDAEQLITLLNQNAENYFMDDKTWLFLDDIKKEIPQIEEQSEATIQPGKIFEFTDDQYYYYLKVQDIKVKNGLSPLNFERKNIRKFIINHRKTQVINQYKQALFEKAKSEKNFEIFN
jgi:hypothetical protein